MATYPSARDAHPKQAGSVNSASTLQKGDDAPIGRPESKAEEEDRREDMPEDMSEDDDVHEDNKDTVESNDVPRLAGLPEIPTGEDLKFDLDSFSFMSELTSEVEQKVHKRASNVLKLTQENEKLQAQLKAMAEQLEEMERLRAQLAVKEQKIEGKPSS